jgi:hypothetical protein
MTDIQKDLKQSERGHNMEQRDERLGSVQRHDDYLGIRNTVEFHKQLAIYTYLQQQRIIIETDPYCYGSLTYRSFLVDAMKTETETAHKEMERLSAESRKIFGTPRFSLSRENLPRDTDQGPSKERLKFSTISFPGGVPNGQHL